MDMRELSAANLAPPEDAAALQDVYRIHCYGCGALNPHGLKVKSRWDGDGLVCHWRPQPFHIGHPGVLYGGAIASVVDCHAIWTALATRCRDVGHDLAAGPPPFVYVTGRLSIDYRAPVSIEQGIDLRAHVVERGDRKSVVACSVFQRDTLCAFAEVVAVRMAAPG